MCGVAARRSGKTNNNKSMLVSLSQSTPRRALIADDGHVPDAVQHIVGQMQRFPRLRTERVCGAGDHDESGMRMSTLLVQLKFNFLLPG